MSHSHLFSGKGVLNTFWAFPNRPDVETSKSRGYFEHPVNAQADEGDAKTNRLVDWMTDVLSKRLREIVIRRKTPQGKHSQPLQASITYKPDHCPLQEVVEAIELPDFDYSSVSYEDPETVEIPTVVAIQLREHIASIAAKYNANPFHSCKLWMQICKLKHGDLSERDSLNYIYISPS
jgi:hypothetical protein